MQYAKDFTDALQFMWGEGFLSPGGPEEVAEMVAGIGLTGKRLAIAKGRQGALDSGNLIPSWRFCEKCQSLSGR